MNHRLLVGEAALRKALPVIEELRHRTSSNPDPLTGVEWLLSRAVVWNNKPIAVILNRDGKPFAAALLSMQRRFGFLTGVVRGGNGTGDGLLVAAAEREQVMAAAIRAVLAIPWVHTVFVSLRGGQLLPPDFPNLTNTDCHWRHRRVATDLVLEGYEEFLSRLGARTRRNHRYYRRRAQAERGLRFVPELTPEDAVMAVKQLHAVTKYPASMSQSLLMEAAIRQTPGSFGSGLRTADGRWISYLAGWRHTDTTFVEWQLNDHGEQANSISTVMRAHLIEHECARHVSKLVFVGGTTTALNRYCAVDRCLDLLVTRKGLRGQFGRTLATKLSPNGIVAKMIQEAA